jgi:TolA-binding protein
MKKMLVIALAVLSLPLFVTGCGSEMATGAVLGAGAVAGGNAVVEGTKIELDKKEAAILARRAEVLAKLETSTSDLEKQQLQAENESLQTKLDQIGTGRVAVDVGDKALKTNWTDPAQVSSFAGIAIAAALAEYFRRKNKTTETKLEVVDTKYGAIKSGVNKTLSESQPEQSKVLYANIGDAQKAAGIKT